MSKNTTIHYRIPLTGLKESTNKIYAGQHWSKRSAFKDSCLSVAGFFCKPAHAIGSYPVEIRYRFLFGTRALDTTNTAYLVKVFEDALRSLGILKEDSPEYVARTIIESVICSGSQRSKACDASGASADAKDKDWLEITINSVEKI